MDKTLVDAYQAVVDGCFYGNVPALYKKALEAQLIIIRDALFPSQGAPMQILKSGEAKEEAKEENPQEDKPEVEEEK